MSSEKILAFIIFTIKSANSYCQNLPIKLEIKLLGLK